MPIDLLRVFMDFVLILLILLLYNVRIGQILIKYRRKSNEINFQENPPKTPSPNKITTKHQHALERKRQENQSMPDLFLCADPSLSRADVKIIEPTGNGQS